MRYENFPTLVNWQADSNESPNRVKNLAARFEAATAPLLAVPPRPRSANLIALDKLVELHGKSFSPMAKRNVLFDLQTELDKRFPPAQPSSEAIKALRDVITRKLADMPAAHYAEVICIGWNIGCNYDKKTGLTSTDRSKNPDYFRHSANDQTDMERKCSEMFSAISFAADAIATNNSLKAGAANSKTLKVFMAPEFYFRGVNGAYSPEIVSQIIPKLRTLGTQSARYADWLFVFGTAVAAIEIEETYCKTCNLVQTIKFVKDRNNPTKTIPVCTKETNPNTHQVVTGSYGAEVQNVALVQKGEETALVAKEYVSGIDYIGAGRGQVRIHPGTKNSAKVDTIVPSGSNDGRHPDGIITQNDERLGGCRLTIDGIRIALEVCLDHAVGIARAQPLEGSTQILLIPSYGMSIGTGLYCVPFGVVFNVDGRGQGSSHAVVKDKIPAVAKVMANTVAGGRGTVEVWGPFQIP